MDHDKSVIASEAKQSRMRVREPSPLAGEGGRRSRPGEGSLR